MPFLMIRNDITKVTADAIVNPANRNLLQGSGTSRAIYQAAGEQELTAATTAGRTAEVVVESRHVLGIARIAFAEIAVITVCHGVFLRPKCVLLLLRSFYRKSCPINISFSISHHLILSGFPDMHQCP